MNTIIGNNLKILRRSKSMSQEEVADFLNISQSAYARIERGDSNSWALHLVKICNFFEITPEELVSKDHLLGNNNDSNIKLEEWVSKVSIAVIEQYEARIKELKKIIKNLKKNRNQ